VAAEVIGVDAAGPAWVAAHAPVHAIAGDFQRVDQIGDILVAVQFQLDQQALEAIAGPAMIVDDLIAELLDPLDCFLAGQGHRLLSEGTAGDVDL
jgi:hypothetical protein